MTKEEKIEKRVSDVMVDQPIEFTVTYSDVQPVEEVELRPFLLLFRRKVKTTVEKTVEHERKFSIQPPKLGKRQILAKYFLELELDEEAIAQEPVKEAMRVSAEKTDTVCRLMAAAVCNTREELMDAKYQAELADFFKWQAGSDDFAVLLLSLIAQQDYKGFIASIRLTKTFRLNKPIDEQEADLVELSEAAPSGAES